MIDLISIIVPVYNRKDVLSQCIHSILAQSHQNFEIVLIDDGSTDGTMELARELASAYSRIVLISGPHCGVSAARNLGIDSAKGDFLFFLDSDDAIHPLLLETLVGELKSSNASVAATGVLSIPAKDWPRVSEQIQQDPGPGETVYMPHEQALHAMFHSFSPLNCIGGVMMKRSLIENTRFDLDFRIGEDFLFVYQNMRKGCDAVFLKQRWYYARLHDQNTSWNFTFEGFWSRFHRREVVWLIEEQLGRTEYSNLQKQNAFSSFLTCILRQSPGGEDWNKTLSVMKQYQSTLFPALSFRDKFRFLMSVHMPRTFVALKRLLHKLKQRT